MNRVRFSNLLLTVLLAAAGSIAQTDQKKVDLDRLNQELKSSFGTGNYDLALRAANQIVTLSEDYYGEKAYETGVAHENVGIISQQKKKYKEATAALQKAIICFSSDDTPSRTKKLSVLSRIALICFLSGDKHEDEALKSALEFAERTFGSKSKQALIPTVDLARFYGRTGRIYVAHEMYLNAYEIVIKNFGINSAEIDRIDDAIVCSEIMVQNSDDRSFWSQRNLLLKDRNDRYDNLNNLATFLFRSAYPNNTLVGDRGRVAVRITIDESGKVTDAKAICEVTKLLGDIAVESVKRSKFRAKMIDGQPTKAKGFFIYNFD